nr:uncharacterized protein LOC111516400 [Leptinotarsa decemlineata]
MIWRGYCSIIHQGQQNSILRHEGMVHAVANRLPRKSQSNHQGSASKDYSQPHTSSTAGACEYCGLQPHSRTGCPARNSMCRKCSSKGHWEKVCKMRSLKPRRMVRNVNAGLENNGEDESREYEAAGISAAGISEHFLGTMSLHSGLSNRTHNEITQTVGKIYVNEKNQWMVNLEIIDFDTKVSFLIDTGADIICYPFHLLKESILKNIINCNDCIFGPDGKNLNVYGKISFSLKCADTRKTHQGDAFIIKDLKVPILGRPAILDLDILHFKAGNLMTIVDESRDSSKVNIAQEYPKVYEELGNFKDEIDIHSTSNPKPFVQSSSYSTT